MLCFVNQKVAASVATVHGMELFCQARRGYCLPGLYSGTFKCQWQSRNRVNETPRSVGDPQAAPLWRSVFKAWSCFLPGTGQSQGGFPLLFCSVITVLLHPVVVYCPSVSLLLNNSPAAVARAGLTPAGKRLGWAFEWFTANTQV